MRVGRGSEFSVMAPCLLRDGPAVEEEREKCPSEGSGSDAGTLSRFENGGIGEATGIGERRE